MIECNLANEEVKKKMEYYKNKLIDKYNRANTKSKVNSLADSLQEFSFIYNELFSNNKELPWENDDRVCNCILENYDKMFNNFLKNIDKDSEFYLNLSESVIDSFYNINYPFYKNKNVNVSYNQELDPNVMMNLFFSFLKSYDYDNYLDFKERLSNFELLYIDFSLYGNSFFIPALGKCFIGLRQDNKQNLFNYQTLAHEYGHILGMQTLINSNNEFLYYKSLETSYYEVISSFFEYAFLNYLKENKIYSNYVNQCLDSYYKEILFHFFRINLLSRNYDLEIDENENVVIDDDELISYGEEIKRKLNYYELGSYYKKFKYSYPYIYGIGSLFSIYLYENYKDNNNFSQDLKKVLVDYPLVNDISVFNDLGINKDKLLKGEVFTKVLKKHSDEYH